jgi:chorismate dehydratase
MGVKISAVSYINTWPMIYGLSQDEAKEEFTLEKVVPSEGARMLRTGETLAGLVPAGSWIDYPNFTPITSYGICADGTVQTVLLVSEVPLNQIRRIQLDPHSRTSVALVQILAKKYWNITPEFVPVHERITPCFIDGYTAAVVIGDKAFEFQGKLPYIYDLAAEWKAFTGLPFVFALWLASPEFPKDKIEKLNEALAFGIAHTAEAIKLYSPSIESNLSFDDYLHYLTVNIKYKINDDYNKALDLFMRYLRDIQDTLVR